MATITVSTSRTWTSLVDASYSGSFYPIDQSTIKLPGASDNVVLNVGNTLTLDAPADYPDLIDGYPNYKANSIRCNGTMSFIAAAAGNNQFTITAPAMSHAMGTFLGINNGQNVTLIGSITAGYGAAFSGCIALRLTGGILKITGDVGIATIGGIGLLMSGGTATITGNISSCGVYGSHGVSASVGTLNIVGNVTGGSDNSAYGVSVSGTAGVNITHSGNCIGGIGHAISITGAGPHSYNTVANTTSNFTGGSTGCAFNCDNTAVNITGTILAGAISGVGISCFGPVSVVHSGTFTSSSNGVALFNVHARSSYSTVGSPPNITATGSNSVTLGGHVNATFGTITSGTTPASQGLTLSPGIGSIVNITTGNIQAGTTGSQSSNALSLSLTNATVAPILNIVGNCTGGYASGLVIAGTAPAVKAIVNITGNAVGSATTANCCGVLVSGAARVAITHNGHCTGGVNGSSAHGISITSTATDLSYNTAVGTTSNFTCGAGDGFSTSSSTTAITGTILIGDLTSSAWTPSIAFRCYGPVNVVHSGAFTAISGGLLYLRHEGSRYSHPGKPNITAATSTAFTMYGSITQAFGNIVAPSSSYAYGLYLNPGTGAVQNVTADNATGGNSNASCGIHVYMDSYATVAPTVTVTNCFGGTVAAEASGIMVDGYNSLVQPIITCGTTTGGSVGAGITIKGSAIPILTITGDAIGGAGQNAHGVVFASVGTDCGCTVLGTAQGYNGAVGSGAAATVTISNGVISPATVTPSNGGTGYLAAPLVTITGGGGSCNAPPSVTLTGTSISSIYFNTGGGYASPPAIAFVPAGGCGVVAGASVIAKATGGSSAIAFGYMPNAYAQTGTTYIGTAKGGSIAGAYGVCYTGYYNNGLNIDITTMDYTDTAQPVGFSFGLQLPVTAELGISGQSHAPAQMSATANKPAAGNVRKGVVYGSVPTTGTVTIPPKTAVLWKIPVDNTEGVLAMPTTSMATDKAIGDVAVVKSGVHFGPGDASVGTATMAKVLDQCGNEIVTPMPIKDQCGKVL